jgi:hypothetical protein
MPKSQDAPLSIGQVCAQLNAAQLQSRPFYPSTVRRLIAAGKFPPPFATNLGPAGFEAFWPDEVARYTERRRGKAVRS